MVLAAIFSVITAFPQRQSNVVFIMVDDMVSVPIYED